MKLKYLFPLLIAVLAAFMASCDEDQTATLLDEIRVTSSFVSIPEDGGSTSITVNTVDSWTLEKVISKKDSVKWLDVSATSGSAGESELNFSAESTVDGRTAEVLLHSAGKTKRINIIQGLAKISEATVAEAKAAPDGKTLRVSGEVTSIVNTEYGNWYITDETGDLYIYGTLDEKGGKQNFESLGLEVGDGVTIEGPKSSYNGDPQMVDVSVLEIRKSLIKINSLENQSLPIEGGEFIAHLSVKGEGVSIDIPEDAKSWLSIAAVESAGDSATVRFQAEPNAGGDRGTTIKFRTVQEGKTYSTETSIFQKGAIIEATIEEFIAAEVGDTQYRLSGVIDRITNEKYGNLYLRDFSGEVLVYGIEDFQEKNLKEGDIITIVGKRNAYKGDPQVGDAVLESSISVTPATIAELLTKPDSDDIYYMVTAEITEIKNEEYGNVDLNDGSDEIHMRGFHPGYGATGDDRKNVLADKGIVVGDQITVIVTKGSYKDVAQLNNGIYVSHLSAE